MANRIDVRIVRLDKIYPCRPMPTKEMQASTS